MKLQFLALALLLGGIQASVPADGGIEGRVLRAGSGDPLANMPVTLISSGGLSDVALDGLLDQMAQLVTIGLQGGGGGGSQDLTIRQVTSLLQTAGPGVGVQASTLTDRAGHFAFGNLPRGRYTVWVQRFNYYGPILNGFPSSTASATVTIEPSKPAASVDLHMTQGMAISGRVLDPRGQPAQGMAITAYRAAYSEGKPLWTPVLSRQIDDRGEYRLAPLPPGEYYVGVTPPQMALLPSGQNVSTRTFFPGVTEPFEATRLMSGGDLSGVDFTIRTAPPVFFKVSGTALNPTPAPSPAGVLDNGFNSFVLMSLETHVIDSFAPNTFINTIPVMNRSAGEFELRNVRPGIYELYPLFPYSGFLSGRTIVDVRNADALGVKVLANPVVTMQGRVTLTEVTPQRPVKLDSLRVVLKPLNMPPVRGVSPVPVPVAETGQFSLSGPSGAKSLLEVAGLPDTAFVSDIRVGNNSVFNDGIDVSAESGVVQIIVDSASGSTLETTVRTGDDRSGARARVVLVPSEDQLQHPMRYKIGTTDSEGRLILRGVPPGAYTAFAWESIPDTAWLNKEFLSKYAGQGTPITIAPRSQTNLQLRWIPFGAELR